MNPHSPAPPAPPSRQAAAPGLSTTSFAILGMLAVRPWTAYELIRQLRRSLSYCWPKAESVLYSEPKRLVRLGLASARTEPSGRRTRIVYDITEDGRRALAGWLRTEPAPPRFEQEGLLRLLYADQGDPGDLLAAIRSTRAWALDRLTEGAAQVRGYLVDGGPFPDRLHLIALFARASADLIEAVLRWCDLAEREVRAWPRADGLGMTDGARDLLEELVARFEQLTPPAAGPAGASAGPVPDRAAGSAR